TGFSVKDILDLPDTNDEEGSVAEGPEEESEGPEPAKRAGPLGQGALDTVQSLPLKNPFYDSSDNPYTRWLASTEGLQDGKPCHALKAQDLAAATFQAGIPFSAYSAQSLQHMQYNAQYSSAGTP
ncbi:hypothetical protein E2I00_018433, partial [Balaenoptera physalus]